MGIVNHEQPFDDEFSREIIAKARELSSDLDEYVIGQQYLVETHLENITPLWLRNRLLIKLVEELADLGITFNVDSDDIVDMPVYIYAVLALRAKFDRARFAEFIKTHPVLADELEQLLDDDCIEDIVGCCSRYLPLDEGWESISNLMANRPGIIQSNGEFNNMLSDTFSASISIGDHPTVDDTNIDKVLEYNKFLSERKAKIIKVASVVQSVHDDGVVPNGVNEIVTQAMSRFESELSRPSVVNKFIESGLDPKTYVDQCRQFFTSRWNHCLEYWVSTANVAAVPSNLEASIMVATLFVDAPADHNARTYVVEVFERMVDQLGERYYMFRDILDKSIGNLVVIDPAIVRS